MKPMRLMPVLAICATLAGALLVTPQPISAKKPLATASPSIYNPYPPGILPADLDSEIARVRREVSSIENEALGQAAALPTPMLTSNPPTIHGSGYDAVRILGKLLNYDPNMSPSRNEAC